MTMRMQRPLFLAFLLGAGLQAIHALTPSRSLAWNFYGGNLVSNWSFENRMQNWDSAGKDSPAFSVDPRFAGSAICTGCMAVTGTFVARVSGFAPVAAAQSRLYSEPFPISPSTAYVLSFYVRSASVAGSTRPVVRFFSDRGTLKFDSASGGNYGSLADWKFQSLAFTAPAGAQYAQVVLAQSAGTGHGGVFHFDDVMLEEGTQPGSRARIGESIGFSNALQGLQNHQRIAARLPGGAAPSCRDSLTLHSLQNTDIRDQSIAASTIVRGIVSSNAALTVGAYTNVYGNARSGGTAFLRSFSLVDGSVRAAGQVTQQAGSQVTGTLAQNVSVPACAIPSKSVPFGVQDINVAGGQTLTLQPGAYRDIRVGANAVVTLVSGVYNVRSFFLEPDVRIRIHLSGSAMEFNAQTDIRLGDRLRMSFLEEEDVFAARFYSNQTTQLYVGTDARLYGTFTAPAGNITLSPRDTLTGALYASTLTVEAGCRIAAPASMGALRNKYRVSGSVNDDFGRPHRTPLPIALDEDTVRYLEDLLPRANAYYQGDSGRPDAHGMAYSESRYAAEPSPRLVEASSPDTAWRMGGKHTLRSDYRFVLDLSIPANIESSAPLPQEAPYRLDWSRDVDSSFTLAWINRLGQTVRTARNMTRNGSDASLWKWSITSFEYFPHGGMKRKTVNLEDGFPETFQYNSQGLTISTYSRTKGLARFFYNRHGKMRFMQDSAHGPGNYTYIEYDERGRVHSQGLQTLASLTQDQVDMDILSAGTKSERIGYIYDDLSTFQARTGIPLASVLPATETLHHGFGRLVCAYNRNADNTAPGFAALDKFVADFYDYDARANTVRHYQYVGPIRKSGRKLQKIANAFDAAGRMAATTVYKSSGSATPVGEHRYRYDLMGRMSDVTGLAGKSLVEYGYHDHGPLRTVLLGGNGSGFSGTEVSYGYHSHGWIRWTEARQAGSRAMRWQQRLGYETPSHPAGSVPSLAQPKFNGSISQQLYQFSSDVAGLKPVRLVNYAYDPMDRMLRAQGYQNANANPLDPQGGIDFSALVLQPSDEMTSRVDYDETGRITGQRSRGVASADSARYRYLPNTFALDHVDGKLTAAMPRDLAPAGSFAYDGRGAMIQDKSKKLTVAYGWDKLPVRFEVATSATTGTHEFQFFDAKGRRVSKLAVAKTGSSTFALSNGKHYVTMGGSPVKEWHETYGAGGTVTDSSEIVTLFGQAAVGRITASGGYQFFLKNHQGSVVKTMDDQGGEPAGGGNSYDYLAYGDLRKLKESGLSVTPKYTGKEFEELYRLYYFGSRFYDPELGTWISPDIAGQYLNPYAFGPSPLNGTDPNGEFFGLDDLIAAGIGAIAGAVTAIVQGYDPLDAEFWAYTGGGALIGWASYATAGAATALIGGGFWGAVAGGAVGGALAGAGNYTLSSGIETGFDSFNTNDFLASVGGGAVGGAVAGGLTAAWTPKNPGWFGKAAYASFTGASAASSGMLASDLIQNGKVDYGLDSYLKGALTGASIAGGMSLGASAYKWASWGRLSTQEKLAILKEDFGAEVHYDPNLEEYGGLNANGEVVLGPSAMEGRAIAENTVLHEMQHIADIGQYNSGSLQVPDGVTPVQYLEHRAHLADIQASPRQYLPARFVEVSIDNLLNTHGYTGHVPKPQLINYLTTWY